MTEFSKRWVNLASANTNTLILHLPKLLVV